MERLRKSLCPDNFPKLKYSNLFSDFILNFWPKILILVPRATFLSEIISHYHFTRLNLKKMGTLQFCHSALLGLHRNPKQKEFLKSSEGFLRTVLCNRAQPSRPSLKKANSEPKLLLTFYLIDFNLSIFENFISFQISGLG